ncbi:GlcNAc-domain-containing protein [Chytriomyces cf. hyalinus JEL632]|nr:GlcNAc-domain-containing protein [Chytriomyces cf. hyalinus JEL632]
MATIFVSVASYRDPACTATINSIFAKAAFPSRVFVGLVQQNDESDTDCLDTEAFDGSPYLQNIRTIRINSSDAKGPTYARYLCASLYHGETFFCQIDSHMTFVDKWDTICIEMMRELQQLHGVAKPILSHYPRELKDEADYMKMEETERYKVPTICKSFFNERGMISFKGAQFVDTKREMYTETPFMAAGFLFTIGRVLKEVPFDPTLDYVFVGEEILHSVRMWTHGYNIFTPRENVIFHEYTREKKPKIWTDKKYSDEVAFGRIKEMLKLGDSNPKSESSSRFGLGHERSLEQFYQFAGINVGAKSESRDFCATTSQSMPTTESPHPPHTPHAPQIRMVEHFAGPVSAKKNMAWPTAAAHEIKKRLDNMAQVEIRALDGVVHVQIDVLKKLPLFLDTDAEPWQSTSVFELPFVETKALNTIIRLLNVKQDCDFNEYLRFVDISDIKTCLRAADFLMVDSVVDILLRMLIGRLRDSKSPEDFSFTI